MDDTLALPSGNIMNNNERELWINNDEGLHRWRQREGGSMRSFLKRNRLVIDRYIERATDKIDIEKCLVQGYYPASKIDI